MDVFKVFEAECFRNTLELLQIEGHVDLKLTLLFKLLRDVVVDADNVVYLKELRISILVRLT